MDVITVDTTDSRQVRQFLDLPFRLYAGTPQWVPPLASDARHQLDRRHNPFFRHSEAVFLLARDPAGRAVGRLAVLDNTNHNAFNHSHTAFFYLFECEHDPAVARALFECGMEWARSRGLNKLNGPHGFTTFDGLGLLVKGFEHRPAYGLPYNLAYYPELVESLGFHGVIDMVSGYLNATLPFPEKIHAVAELVKKRRGLRVMRCENKRDMLGVIPKLQKLYNDVLSSIDEGTPLTDDEVKALADQLLWFADPHLIKIIVKAGAQPGDPDEPVGFLLAYPDISGALQRTRGRLFPFGWVDLLLELRRTKWVNVNGAGILPQYRGLGGTALLFSEMYKSVTSGGFAHADLVQINAANDKMQRELRGLGIDFYKTHRVYELDV